MTEKQMTFFGIVEPLIPFQAATQNSYNIYYYYYIQ